MAPCLLGYFAVAEMLRDHASTIREGNRYWAWIENYVAEDYTEAVRLGSGGFFLFSPLSFILFSSFFSFLSFPLFYVPPAWNFPSATGDC